jgi:hypothetical protein
MKMKMPAAKFASSCLKCLRLNIFQFKNKRKKLEAILKKNNLNLKLFKIFMQVFSDQIKTQLEQFLFCFRFKKNSKKCSNGNPN